MRNLAISLSSQKLKGLKVQGLAWTPTLRKVQKMDIILRKPKTEGSLRSR